MRRVGPAGVVRFALRLSAMAAWSVGLYLILAALSGFQLLLHRGVHGQRRALARRWAQGIAWLTGMHVEVHGSPPPPPFFLVANHLCWMDGFSITRILDCLFVGMAEMKAMPVAGRFISALDTIYVDRSNRREIPQINDAIRNALENGRSVMLFPEAVVSPGKTVRRFRPALLEHAVRDQRPVYYASVVYRTPPGSPPASQVCLYGPDPYYRTPDGQIPDSELEAWGPERPFLPYLYRLLALPSFTAAWRFAPDPLVGQDRTRLAQDLRDAVAAQFEPLE